MRPNGDSQPLRAPPLKAHPPMSAWQGQNASCARLPVQAAGASRPGRNRELVSGSMELEHRGTYGTEIEKFQGSDGKNEDEEEKYLDVISNKNIKLSERVLIPVKQYPKLKK
ncbi:hypothetical protein MJG53_017133 [Ovis ammon polii x Ovis aries]|uniref:Uncharacterized protein n=1 Tax=Ovis ammon polii x Ovis aries TaxID=2918886 RepID=A0ACB9U7E0_9CETA|nr:hypothetical protein MJG53_017133 [Ovis ammon polii x Ovis aries]